MDQKKLKTNKKLPAALSTAALKQVKGGFREMPGTVGSSISVRWDEIIIRVYGGNQGKGLTGNHQNTTLSSDSGMQGVMP